MGLHDSSIQQVSRPVKTRFIFSGKIQSIDFRYPLWVAWLLDYYPNAKCKGCRLSSRILSNPYLHSRHRIQRQNPYRLRTWPQSQPEFVV